MKTSKLGLWLGLRARIQMIAWALFGLLSVISILVAYQNCQPKVNFNTEPARTFASACGEAQDKPFSASP